jgi:hypothetical protein
MAVAADGMVVAVANNGTETVGMAARAPGMVEAGSAEVAGIVAGGMAGVVAAADGVVALASGLAR